MTDKSAEKKFADDSKMGTLFDICEKMQKVSENGRKWVLIINALKFSQMIFSQIPLFRRAENHLRKFWIVQLFHSLKDNVFKKKSLKKNHFFFGDLRKFYNFVLIKDQSPHYECLFGRRIATEKLTAWFTIVFYAAAPFGALRHFSICFL